MVRVVDVAPSGRRRELAVEAVPAGSAGPVRFAVGRWSTPERSTVPAPRPPADELVVVANVLGVLVDRRAA
ncbi:hypothetical protein ACWCXH_33775 [Kitasatospora sp. NPDC001660]